MSGTDNAYGAPPCPVLTWRMVLPGDEQSLKCDGGPESVTGTPFDGLKPPPPRIFQPIFQPLPRNGSAPANGHGALPAYARAMRCPVLK
eukprot:2276551-Rhodomonas_salina.2